MKSVDANCDMAPLSTRQIVVQFLVSHSAFCIWAFIEMRLLHVPSIQASRII